MIRSKKMAANILIAAATTAMSFSVMALSNSAKVPVFFYHSHQVAPPCDYGNNSTVALAQDLETIRNKGFTVVPLYWIAEWMVGNRDGSTLPDKVVGLAFDDGMDLDWIDNVNPNDACAPLKSFRTVLQEFKAAHTDLPWYSPHAANFVIGSPVARAVILPGYLNDTWWNSANASGFMEIYNHSADHDNAALSGPYWEPWFAAYVPVRGYATVGNWQGADNFAAIDNYQSSKLAVTSSAAYIATKTGAWPDLFVYPNGLASNYLRYTYFPNYSSEHQTLAAFTGELATKELTYVTRQSERYFLGRFGHGAPMWKTPTDFSAILDGAL